MRLYCKTILTVCLFSWAAISPLALAQELENGHVTTTFEGESQTLPLRFGEALTEWQPPLSRFDDPSRTSIRIVAGADPQTGEHWLSMNLVFDRNTLEIVGTNQISDSRAQNEAGVVEPASTLWSNPKPEFTIEEYEVRGTSAFVRGSFNATMSGGKQLTGSFEVLAPGVCPGDQLPGAEGCT